MKNIVLLLILISTMATAQYKDMVWCFGDSAGINFSNPSNPTTFKSQMKSQSSFTSISDSNGNLVYYIGSNEILPYDHVKIFSNSNAIIQNGDSIINNQNAVILSVQFPNIKNRFIVFTNAKFGNIDGMYYSVFEMDSTSQNGTVLIKNNFMLPKIGTPLATVRHANGRDWWVVRLPYFQLNAGLDFLLVTDTGIAGPFTQNINTPRSFLPGYSS